jgi:tRNA(Met) C34 N-acetyltransferase TmcA
MEILFGAITGILVFLALLGSTMILKDLKLRKEKEVAVKQKQFESDFRGIVLKNTKDLAIQIQDLLLESLDMIQDTATKEEYETSQNQAFKIIKDVNNSIENFSTAEMSESIVSLSLLQNQLKTMVDKLVSEIDKNDKRNVDYKKLN